MPRLKYLVGRSGEMVLQPHWDRVAKLEALYRASERFARWVDPPEDMDDAAQDYWRWVDAMDALTPRSVPRSEGHSPPPQAA